MPFTDEQTAALSGPLDKAHVKSRTQAGRELSYIEAWHAIAEANRIFGFDGWQRETVDLIPLGEPRLVDGKWRVAYRAKVRITVRSFAGELLCDSFIREGCGFGSGIDRDPDQAHESALKEAESDAMKRALMTFGNPFGLALYDKTQANVVDGAGGADDGGARRDLSPHPEGKDWWGCDGSGPTAYQAKKDGLDLMHENFRAEIAGLSSATAWREWCGDRSDDIKRMPKSWRVILRAEAEEKAHELGVDFNARRAA